MDANYETKESHDNDYSRILDVINQLLEDVDGLKCAIGNSSDGKVGNKRAKSKKSNYGN